MWVIDAAAPFRKIENMLSSLCFVLAFFALLVSAEEDPTCWAMTRTRGIGKPVIACPDGLVRSGLLCYPPCANQNATGLGPICWNGFKPVGRGFGRVLGCGKDREYVAGLCYKPCPDGFYSSGLWCVEKCPASAPYPCGFLCTVDADGCNAEYRELSMSGFAALSGIAAIAASILVTIGTSGMAAAVAALGLVTGTASFGSGLLTAVENISSYPFCSEAGKNSAVANDLKKLRKQFENAFGGLCFKNSSSK